MPELVTFDCGEVFFEGGFITLPGGRVIHVDEKGEHGAKESGGGKESAKPAGRRQETPEELKARNERVMGKLPHIQEALPKLREKVQSDLHLSDADKRRVAAAVTRIIDSTTMRVGSERYATKSEKGGSGQDSFGASSLRKQHVRVEGDTVHFEFPGKSRKNWKRSVTDPALADVVKHLQSLPGERLMQYHDEKGNLRPFTEQRAREYMDEHGIDPKNFRTHHATMLAKQILDEMGPAKSQAEAKKNINEAVKRVSEHLGNTPAMARASYIHPAVLEDYAKGGGSANMSNDSKPSQYLHPDEVEFGKYLKELQEKVHRGEIKGEDPFPEDVDETAGDDEDGLDADAEFSDPAVFDCGEIGFGETKGGHFARSMKSEGRNSANFGHRFSVYESVTFDCGALV